MRWRESPSVCVCVWGGGGGGLRERLKRGEGKLTVSVPA